MRKWYWLHQLPMQYIRHSAICLFKQKSFHSGMQLFVPAGPRSVEEQHPWMFHLMKVHNAEIKDVSYETDRCSIYRSR